ncbi:MAG TPA: OmpA family protein, partial [Marinilabiliaceae bacterium]|nr:OmpA family protein [Marinilabiliaceae bacterium]
FGGLDLFKSDQVDGNWGSAKNLGQPYNSNKDDFGYVINPKDNNRGFLSTNRVGDGSDVIFYVQEREEEKEDEPMPPVVVVDSPPEEVAEVEVPEVPVVIEEPKVDLSIFPSSLKSYVLSTFNGNLLEGASISMVDSYTGKIVGQSKTDSKGGFTLSIPDQYRQEGQEFQITVSMADFKNNVVQSNIMELPEIAKAGFQISPIFKDPDLNEISGLIIPYVGLEFSAEGYTILDQVATYLLNNPQVVIKLNGHTDVRGTMMSNLNNSQNISEKAENYLLSKGVSSDNLIPRGYGERYIINKCRRGKLCDESEHLENRRVEIVVWRINN